METRESRMPGRKPLWRSRLLWLGMLGLCFLIWAWRDSTIHWWYIGFNHVDFRTSIGASEGGLSFYLDRSRSFGHHSGFVWDCYPYTAEAEYVEPAWAVKWFPPAGVGEFPYWLMLLVYLPVWLGALIWRRR